MSNKLISVLKGVLFIVLGLVIFYYSVTVSVIGKSVIMISVITFIIGSGVYTQHWYFGNSNTQKWYVSIFKVLIAGIISAFLVAILIYVFGRGAFDPNELGRY
ncbi:hypothetical protein LJ707_13420 [Mucilaginibacter sp. UR6-1]|uniref:hypothetical protein n=1 Tax=Mucilaginibacter sp. UR6-1 TaxID=1435643 RepID=UPI001E39F3CF|nr:hypothetical protein [Mucilaginibacter sp. UR6-1]MCC8409932.1 hypothetical protein [Mucilaginibacter sp. UR6-1]